MIIRELVMTVNNNTASLNEPLTIYQHDRGVTLKIKILKYKYMFDKLTEEDVVVDNGIISARAIILKPDGETAFECPREVVEDDYVMIYITRDWTDEMIEIGKYRLQIQLYGSDYINERITLPPIEFNVARPIGFVAEDGIPYDTVGMGVVGISTITEMGEASEDDLENNIYNKTEWTIGDPITAAKLNKIENAIYDINENVKEINPDNFATNEAMNTALEDKADVEHTHEQYLTEHQDISHLATLENMNNALEGKADSEHYHEEYLTEHQDISHLATTEAMNSALANKSNTGHIHNQYATTEYVNSVIPNIVVLTANEYAALTTKDPNTLYLIKEI